jgi:hypothetical protein
MNENLLDLDISIAGDMAFGYWLAMSDQSNTGPRARWTDFRDLVNQKYSSTRTASTMGPAEWCRTNLARLYKETQY